MNQAKIRTLWEFAQSLRHQTRTVWLVSWARCPVQRTAFYVAHITFYHSIVSPKVSELIHGINPTCCHFASLGGGCFDGSMWLMLVPQNRREANSIDSTEAHLYLNSPRSYSSCQQRRITSRLEHSKQFFVCKTKVCKETDTHFPTCYSSEKCDFFFRGIAPWEAFPVNSATSVLQHTIAFLNTQTVLNISI